MTEFARPPEPSKEARAAGHAWYDRVCKGDELMIEVARRLGTSASRISAIRQGREPIPDEWAC